MAKESSPQIARVAEQHLVILLWHVPLADEAGLAVEALPGALAQDALGQVLVVLKAAGMGWKEKAFVKIKLAFEVPFLIAFVF